MTKNKYPVRITPDNNIANMIGVDNISVESLFS